MGTLSRILFRGITLIICATLLTFLLVKLSPQDPVQEYLLRNEATAVTPQQRKYIAEYWGAGQPVFSQYFQWIGRLLRGDLGVSLLYRQPTASIIAECFQNTFLLMAAAWIFSGVAGYAIGGIMGYYRGGLIDGFLRRICLFLTSIPAFWLGLLFLTFFSVYLKWFPIGFSAPIGSLPADVSWQERLYHMVLPVTTLSLASLPATALHTREKYHEVFFSDYVLFGRALGKSGWRLFKDHIFKNTAIPAIVMGFSGFADLFGGSIVAENVFSYPGLGSAMTAAGLNADIPLLLGITLVSAIFVFCGHVLSDATQRWMDVRVKEGGAYV